MHLLPTVAPTVTATVTAVVTPTVTPTVTPIATPTVAPTGTPTVAPQVLSVVFSLSTAITNLLLKLTNRVLTGRERHGTSRARELSTFNKLATAYLLNSVLVPLLVYSFPIFVSQAWYENGGAVASAVILLAADIVSGVGRCIQFPQLFKRFVLAPLTVHSQRKLNKLWEPPPMFIGELYAQIRSSTPVQECDRLTNPQPQPHPHPQIGPDLDPHPHPAPAHYGTPTPNHDPKPKPYANVFKSVAICLVYAPLWPLSYALCAASLLAGCAYARFPNSGGTPAPPHHPLRRAPKSPKSPKSAESTTLCDQPDPLSPTRPVDAQTRATSSACASGGSVRRPSTTTSRPRCGAPSATCSRCSSR